MGHEIWKMGAVEMAAAIRTKKVSSKEVIQAHIDRIAAVNPRLNAVTVVLADEALGAAEAADRAVASGQTLGPLHGVPISVKENIDLAGSATTQGIVAMAEAIPAIDAPHVKQIKAAGAIPFARTNLPDFGLRWHSDNALRGATKNPWNPALTPGGSSGGEAAALATGMTPLGLGNDYGGSLRWPAQCNGISSLKPTLGRIPNASALAPQEGTITLQMFAVEGPMARRVTDLRTAFRAMIGADWRDPWWVPVAYEGPAGERPLRVAVTIDPGGVGVDGDVADGVRKAAKALAGAGYAVEELDPPQVREAMELWAGLVMAEIAAGFSEILGQLGSADANSFLDLALKASPPMDGMGYVLGLANRNAIARAWTEFQERYPIIIGPVNTRTPFQVGKDLESVGAVRAIIDSMAMVVPLNLLGLPAVVVPVGVANGMPQAVQVIGGRYREDLCLEAAEAIEAALGIVTPIEPSG